MIKFIVATEAILLCAISAAVAGPRHQLDISSCVKTDASYDIIGQTLIGKNWSQDRNFMQICPIDAAPGKPILFVYALDTNDPNVVPYKNGKPFDIINDLGPPDPFPLPRLIDTRHRVIGMLPVQVYASAPQSVSITFSSWTRGFPFKISVHVVDPTVAAPLSPYCPPPLIWHPAEHKYVEAKGDFYSKCGAVP
jgi:hypothetical protein